MRYEALLAKRYIRAQRRQSAFTVLSIATAVAVMAMVFLLYSVAMQCMRITAYAGAPCHLTVSGLTETQGEALQAAEHVGRLRLERAEDGTVSAQILFGSEMGDREIWIQDALQRVGAEQLFYAIPPKYEWNDTLMNLDGIGDGAHLFRLRIFCIFFIFAVLAAFALRLIIDTAFEVSSKEREQHYGVLQSVGATPEQIVRIITSEGLRLCVIAVPLGLIAGIGLAYLMYHVLLRAGLAELFQGMSNAKLALPFSVDWKMLAVAALVGAVWVFLSAYGVGMRIIKKSPMEAITARADNVERVRRRSLSGLLFGISGSIASRNARRQKKRFVITVLTLTVSITLFALFSTLTETVERSIGGYITACFYNSGTEPADFEFEIGNYAKGISAADAEQALEESGLFEHIAVEVIQALLPAEDAETNSVLYVNREAYTQLFGADAAVSYDELVRSGGYVSNADNKDHEQDAGSLKSSSLPVLSFYRWLPEDADKENMSRTERLMAAESEFRAHTLDIIGSVSAKRGNIDYIWLFGAIETYQQIEQDWFGEFFGYASASFSFAGSSAEGYRYNAADLKKAQDWFRAHPDFISPLDNEGTDYDGFYRLKWRTHSILATVRAGVLILNLLIALAALINLMNIISTGIANRRSELASLQCVGMTDRQLDRMAIIECLQFAGAAAIISAILCALIIFGIETGLTVLIRASFAGEREEARKMLTDLVRIDRTAPFVRIACASLAAFAAGCVTSLVMLRHQRSDSLSDQIRGTEMAVDTRKTHLLRNAVITAAGIAVLTVAGLRIYSVAAYHRDRNAYAKAGYLDLVNGTDGRINVFRTGAEHGKHTIVGLAGMGVHSFPIVTSELNARLGRENTLVYPDRAGYGFSDDSRKDQSLEQVVGDYRAALKNAGFQAPYVLMGHSYGAFYALWWQMKYPDEVEAIIFLDGTWLGKNALWDSWTIDEFPSESDAYAAMRRYRLRTWLGLDRLFPAEESSDGTYGKALFSAEQLALWDLTENREWSAASLSELANETEAARTLREILQPTDIPKLCFSTVPTCEADLREAIEFQNADIRASGNTPKLDPEMAARAEWARDGWAYQDICENELKPFLERCGSCRLVPIGGDHGLFFAQKPDAVADEITALLAQLG